MNEQAQKMKEAGFDLQSHSKKSKIGSSIVTYKGKKYNLEKKDIKKIVKNYGVVEIMEKLNDEYGDDFITESYTKRGLKIKTISGINIHGYVSATVDHFPELVTIKYEDERLWNDKKETLYKECGL